jgi:hypothetical protein
MYEFIAIADSPGLYVHFGWPGIAVSVYWRLSRLFGTFVCTLRLLLEFHFVCLVVISRLASTHRWL